MSSNVQLAMQRRQSRLEANAHLWYKADMSWRGVRFAVPFGRGVRLLRIAEGTQDPGLIKHVHVPGYWYLHLLGYKADLWIDGKYFPIRPGFAGILPPSPDIRY